MPIIPFGKYKGKDICSIDSVYIIFLLGYINHGKCCLPDKQIGWTYRYSEFYLELLNSIVCCIRCGGTINKKSENEHLNVLCNECYEKHKNGICFRRCKKERNSKQVTNIEEDGIMEKIIKKYDLKHLLKRGGLDIHWEQELQCVTCMRICYSPMKIGKYYYNMCKLCFPEKLQYELQHNDKFDDDLYKQFFNKLDKSISMINVSNLSSCEVTKLITRKCIKIAQELNFQYVLEKKAKHPLDDLMNVFYDIELCHTNTKFIIEIDRSYNNNSISKMNDAGYNKCIWIRWGKITDKDVSDEKYDIITLPLKCIKYKWYSTMNVQKDLTYYFVKHV